MTTGNTNAVYGTTDYPHGTVTVTVSDEESSGFEATVTASRADGLSPSVSKRLVLSAATQSVAFDLVPGTWTFSTTYSSDASGADTADQTVTAGGEYSVGLSIAYVHATVYGIIYDKSLAADPAGCLTYTGACEGFTPMSGGNGDADEGSWAEGNGTIFDAIQKIRFPNVNDSVHTLPKHETYTESTYWTSTFDHFTRIPKIYQKVTDLGDSKVKLEISLEQFEGSTLHPAFVMDGTEYDYKDIGRFLGVTYSSSMEFYGEEYEGMLRSNAYVASTTYNPKTKPSNSSTSASGYTEAASLRGEGYGILSYFDWDLVNKLFLLGFKTFDAKSALGTGEKSSKVSALGSTILQSWMYGSATDNTVHVSFLGIEDWWGNVKQWLSNFRVDSTNLYVSHVSLSTGFSPEISDMDVLCANPSIQGYPLTCRAGLNDFFIAEDSGGSVSTGLCDRQEFKSGSYYGRVGGWSNNYGSPFYFLTTGTSLMSSDSDSSSGARLVHWGNNETSS